MSRLERDSAALPRALIWLILAAGLVAVAVAATHEPETVSFPTADDGRIHGDLYGFGAHGVVLAHGAVFDKGSWQPLALALAAAGYRALAFDFRGYGRSVAGSEGRALYLDVLAAARFLRQRGATSISVIGASMGGGAAARAATESRRGELHNLVLLAPAPIATPQAMQFDRLLVVASRGERGLSRIRDQYDRAPEPKRLELLAGSAHAQHVFRSAQGDALTEIILRFLAEN